MSRHGTTTGARPAGSRGARAEPVRLVVNGVARTLAVPPEAPLLNVLRNDLALNGPKYGCGLGECGACAVLVDGIEARACVIPVGGVDGRAITTLEGLGTLDGSAEKPGEPPLHPVQQAFIDAQAAQCGYCLNGMIVTTVALLRRRPDPSDAQIRAALAHNLCRCGAHLEILDAVRLAARRLGGGAAPDAGPPDRPAEAATAVAKRPPREADVDPGLSTRGPATPPAVPDTTP